MLATLAAALILQLAPVPTPAGGPPASFPLHGFTAAGQPTDAPVLARVADGPTVAVAFTAPVDSACMVAELVHVDGHTMALPLSRGEVTLGGAVHALVPLPSARALADAGATADGVTIVAVCAVLGDPTSLTASRVYHADGPGQDA